MGTDNHTEELPTYLRPRFVISVVVAAVVVGLLLHWLGSPDNKAEITAADGPSRTQPVDAGVTKQPVAAAASVDNCPAPGAVDLEAAQTVSDFMEGVATPGAPEVPASEEIQEVIEAAAPSPAVLRMTRIRGFSPTDAASVLTCVVSTHVTSSGVTTSLDFLRVEGTGDDEWEVTEWAQGQQQALVGTRVVGLTYFDSGEGCRGPDRLVSVQNPAGAPGDRLRRAMEELTSGTAGRAVDADTQIPPDVQVVDARVEGDRAIVVLTPTTEDMTRCEGTGAAEQVVETARAVLAESLPPPEDEDDEPAGEVELQIEGEVVTTLRR